MAPQTANNNCDPSMPGDATNPTNPTNPANLTPLFYHLIILLGTTICQYKMRRVVKSIPVVESSPAAREDQSAVKDDVKSNSPPEDLDAIAESKPDLEATRDSSNALNSDPVLSSTEEPLQDSTTRKETSLSRSHKTQFIQSTILHLVLAVITFRLGFLTVHWTQEPGRLRDKAFALASFSLSTIIMLFSMVEITRARIYSKQGFRVSSNAYPPGDTSDSLSNIVVFSTFSLFIPWIWLLFPLVIKLVTLFVSFALGY